MRSLAPHVVTTCAAPLAPWRAIARRQHTAPLCIHSLPENEPAAAPWAITFDLRERETIWTEENKVRLIKQIAAERLEVDVDELETRLATLLLLVPGLQVGFEASFVRRKAVDCHIAGCPATCR